MKKRSVFKDRMPSPHPTIASVLSNDAPSARKYRSRKQKPCDNCRRRRVCCVRDAEGDCALCIRRSIPCTFSSDPSPRKRQAKSATTPSTDPHGESTSEIRSKPRRDDQVDRETKISEQRSGVEGNYIGLSGTDDLYFVVDRSQVVGNDPARVAYFRACSNSVVIDAVLADFSSLQERSSSVASASTGASRRHSHSVEPDAAFIRSIFVEQSHPAYPLLEIGLARSDKQSRLLAVAIAIITKYTSPELEGLNNNVLIEELTASLLLEARSPALETVEAAILFTQRALRGKMYAPRFSKTPY